jgi:hypothetical protein
VTAVHPWQDWYHTTPPLIPNHVQQTWFAGGCRWLHRARVKNPSTSQQVTFSTDYWNNQYSWTQDPSTKRQNCLALGWQLDIYCNNAHKSYESLLLGAIHVTCFCCVYLPEVCVTANE